MATSSSALHATLATIADIRRRAGLPPEPESDRIWADRILNNQATIQDATARIQQKADTQYAGDHQGAYDGPVLVPGGPTPPGGENISVDGVTRQPIGGGAPVPAPTSPAPGSTVTTDPVGTPEVIDPAEQARQEELERQRQDARARLENLFQMFGLTGLTDWAWGRLQAGDTFEMIMQELRQRPEYQQRFPAMAALREKGRAISEAQYIANERQYTQIARRFGLPETFYDQPEDFSSFIASEMSPIEFQDRLKLWQEVAQEKAADPANQDTLEEMNRLYGITPDSGEFLAMVIDPKRALPAIERQVKSARVSSIAANTGFGQLARTEAERLSELDRQQATQGFSTLARSRELFTPLPGREAAEDIISRNQQLGAVFDADEDAFSRIERRARVRTAEFEGGGGVSGGRSGLGVGRADR